MAGREGMLFKFFEKWKDRKLNSFAKNMLKGNPQLEKDLKELGDSFAELEKEFAKAKK
tara:strand:- start:675 stop:848 length:174 start_codon:yes stop_codon:yes gene_type:complete